MTKFGDKLRRLHTSQIRSNAPDDQEACVFVADTEQHEFVIEKSLILDKKFDALRRIEKRKKKPNMKRSDHYPSSHEKELQDSNTTRYALRAPTKAQKNDQSIKDRFPQNEIGEHLKDLRIQASALLDAGRSTKALILLYEILAFSPDNPFALSKLVTLFRNEGELKRAEFFNIRLQRITKY